VKCSHCGWEGHLALISYLEKGWQFTTPPLCLICRQEFRKDLRRKGIMHSRVVPCPV
jgi:hypothetical protein